MVETLDRGIRERRSIEEAHADLVASHKKRPSCALARMIEQLEAEIAARGRPYLNTAVQVNE